MKTGDERFKVVIYACVAGNANPEHAISECREYAETFGWEVTQEICDNTGLLPPQGRDGLAMALDLVQAKAVGAVLTAYRSMISPRHDEFDEVAAEVEKRGDRGGDHHDRADRRRLHRPAAVGS
ncbi:hypothetical protein ACFVYG_26925 [Streptomyces sp. NPDC058256]|uniref:hypothetical protein n=1 Tax=Streptomyces sp. NPDC058256 TaxID=3346408 RepID=UPI0036ED14CC